MNRVIFSPSMRGEGSVQVAPDEPIPYRLITRIVEFRVRKNEAKAKEEEEEVTAARPQRR